jgi:hypothetical protein
MNLFPRQEEFLRWLEERERLKEDAAVEKSRDMGVTWLCAGFLIHHWLFHPGFKGGIGSRKEILVDRLGDPDSIFEKMRILLRNLPKWMLPAGFNWKKHDSELKLLNPDTQASITGEAGDNIGRGGRNAVYIVDEAAFIDHPQLADAALSQNTNCRFYVSTPHGGGLFSQKCTSGQMPVFRLHWKDDPRKNAWELVDKLGATVDYGLGGSSAPELIPPGCCVIYPWYEREKARLRDPVAVAQELDIDHTASVEGITIPALWVQAAINLHQRLQLPESDYRVAGLDVADGGNCETVLVTRRGITVEHVYARTESGTTDTANWALDLSKAARVRTLNYDATGVGAGISGTFKARAQMGTLGIVTAGINAGASPTDAKWPDGRTSKERFANLKAELWWIVRTRFEKTYEMVELGITHPLDELISIPDHVTLTRQLSNVRYDQTEAGKTQIESKKLLQKRGVASPDYADALMLAFAPAKRVTVRTAVGGERTAVTQYIPR